jgi:hypothetical protein
MALGEWLRNIPPIRAAAGLLLLLVTASFSLGAASANIHRIPKRIESLEARDSSDALLLATLGSSLERHIRIDSIATARIYCVVEAMYEGETVNPLECERNRNQ